MARNPRRVARELDELYARLPKLACQGLCADSCGPIDMSVAERDRIRRAGVTIPDHAEGFKRLLECGDMCPALVDGRCSVYSIRPIICRLWGMTEEMPCTYGCVPEGGHLSAQASFLFMHEAMEIGGWPPGWPRPTAAQFRRMCEDRGVLEVAKDIMRAGSPAHQRRSR